MRVLGNLKMKVESRFSCNMQRRANNFLIHGGKPYLGLLILLFLLVQSVPARVDRVSSILQGLAAAH